MRIRKIRREMAIASAPLAVAFLASVISAYNPFQDAVNGSPVPTRWSNSSVTWRLNPTLGSNVDTTGGPNVATALAAAFNVWRDAPLNGTVVNALTLARGADTTKTDPDANDCQNTVSLVPSSSVQFPTGTVSFAQVVTITPTPGQNGPPYTYDVCGGLTSNFASVIFDSDMMFNPASSFSTSTPSLPDHFDVQATASHEFGHLLGLDHSGIAHTMLFPFGDVGSGQQRNLATDDVVGVAFLYPAANFAAVTGTISGTVSQNGSGIFASHVVVIDEDSGAPVIDGLSNPDGTYRLLGVPPGNYNVVALPLASLYTIDNFSGWECGYATNADACTGAPANPTDYTGTFH